MDFDIVWYNIVKGVDKFVDLLGCGIVDGIGNIYMVDICSIGGFV